MIKIIKLVLEDINTLQYGENFAIKIDEGNQIILSPEAAKELHKDLGEYLEANKNEDVYDVTIDGLDDRKVIMKGLKSVVR